MRKNRNKTANEYNAVSARGFHIEADRVSDGISVSVFGVIAIPDFCEESATLKLRRGRVKIDGTGLSVSVYENKTVEISGKICRVEFL